MLLYILDIDVACYHYEGIDAVKAALKAGLEVSSEEMPVKVCSKQYLLPSAYNRGCGLWLVYLPPKEIVV